MGYYIFNWYSSSFRICLHAFYLFIFGYYSLALYFTLFYHNDSPLLFMLEKKWLNWKQYEWQQKQGLRSRIWRKYRTKQKNFLILNLCSWFLDFCINNCFYLYVQQYKIINRYYKNSLRCYKRHAIDVFNSSHFYYNFSGLLDLVDDIIRLPFFSRHCWKK